MNTQDWWVRQLCEAAKEAAIIYETFRSTDMPNMEQYDKAVQLYEECCFAYSFNELTFLEFIELGKGLCARQAHIIIQKDYDYE